MKGYIESHCSLGESNIYSTVLMDLSLAVSGKQDLGFIIYLFFGYIYC